MMSKWLHVTVYQERLFPIWDKVHFKGVAKTCDEKGQPGCPFLFIVVNAMRKSVCFFRALPQNAHKFAADWKSSV